MTGGGWGALDRSRRGAGPLKEARLRGLEFSASPSILQVRLLIKTNDLITLAYTMEAPLKPQTTEFGELLGW